MSVLSAVDYGLVTAASAAVNGQAITDAMAAAGVGGAVTIPSGTYVTRGALHDRRRTLVLADGAVLQHPDGDTGGDIITARKYGKLCGATAGSGVVTPDTMDNVHAGALARIVDAGDLYDGVRQAHHARIVAVGTATFTIEPPVIATVAGVSLTVGADRPMIEGGEWDGNRPAGGSANNPFPINWDLVADGRIDGATVHGGDHGAFFFTACWGCVVQDADMYDCGDPANQVGAVAWFFRASQGCRLYNSRIHGACWSGAFIDDRTTTTNTKDGSSDENRIERNTIDIDFVAGANFGIAAAGGSRNKIRRNVVRNFRHGIMVTAGGQGVERPTVDNLVEANQVDTCTNGVYLGIAGQRVLDNYITAVTTPVNDVSGGNTVSNNGSDAAILTRIAAIAARDGANIGRPR